MNVREELRKIASLITGFYSGLKMHNFKTRPNATLLAIIEAQRTKDGGEVNTMITSAGRKQKWMNSATREIERGLQKVLKEQPTKEYGFNEPLPEGEEIAGVVQIGEYSVQNSWSDDGYIAVKASTPRAALGAIKVIKKYAGTTGGGVPGSSGYKGSGAISKGDVPTEYSYHYSSFGIGD